jgi:NAD+ synthase
MLSRDVLVIDAMSEAARIERKIREQIQGEFRRAGAVVGLSGGVDSSVVAMLLARALGPERVLGLLMPERDSSSDALRLGRLAAKVAGIDTIVEDLTQILTAAGCYARQTDAIRSVFPEYGDGWRCKLSVPPISDGLKLPVPMLTVEAPSGEQKSARMDASSFRALVAATNFKQRARKMFEYYHADRLHYAVAGTPNRQEYALGFFVKQGDGAADVKPIAHLYKVQVYALAAHLGVPDEIRQRPPTTDTYSLPQTQEEFYFALPHAEMDLCLWAYDHGVAAEELATALGISSANAARAYRDIEGKKRAVRYLDAPALLAADMRGA